MQLPTGVVDPLFTAELARELKMSVTELGQRMSNWELSVFWPAYFASVERDREWREQQGMA